METLSTEIFNILKGAGYKIRLYDEEGKETLDTDEATRLYAVDQNLIVTLIDEDNKIETIVKVGNNFDIKNNKDILDAIKAVTHNRLGEYTMRKFDKNIMPKDTVAEGFTRAEGSTKTSYVKLPEATLIIKHNKKVNEEVRGSRSRNIHSLFIENTQGEKFAFPHKYMAGAKAMTMHVNEGGTPYDDKGKAILSMCEEIAELGKFSQYTRKNKLVNEENQDVVETVKSHMNTLKEEMKKLSTMRGYNNFKVQEKVELDEESVDIADRFQYNALRTEGMEKVLSTVNRIVSETKLKEASTVNAITNLEELINIVKSGTKVEVDSTDPEHPDNSAANFGGTDGDAAKLSHMLSFVGMAAVKAKEFELSNLLDHLSVDIMGMNKTFQMAVGQLLDKLSTSPVEPQQEAVSASIDKQAVSNLRRKVG